MCSATYRVEVRIIGIKPDQEPGDERQGESIPEPVQRADSHFLKVRIIDNEWTDLIRVNLLENPFQNPPRTGAPISPKAGP